MQINKFLLFFLYLLILTSCSKNIVEESIIDDSKKVNKSLKKWYICVWVDSIDEYKQRVNDEILFLEKEIKFLNNKLNPNFVNKADKVIVKREQDKRDNYIKMLELLKTENI